MAQKIQGVFFGIVMFILQLPKPAKEKSDFEWARVGIMRAGTFEDANEILQKFLKKHEEILADEKNTLYNDRAKEAEGLCILIYKKWPYNVKKIVLK